MDKILHKVSDITAKLHNLTDAVRKFEQCKACKKRYYKAVDNADISFEDQLSNVEFTSSLYFTKSFCLKQPSFIFDHFTTT